MKKIIALALALGLTSLFAAEMPAADTKAEVKTEKPAMEKAEKKVCKTTKKAHKKACKAKKIEEKKAEVTAPAAEAK
jgi:hypothetical protein